MSIRSWRKATRKHTRVDHRTRYLDFIRRWTSRPMVSRLEDRITPAATLAPGLEPAILSGLNSIAATADSIDNIGQFAASLPVVGQSIGKVLDFGQRIKNELVTPIQTYLAANDPTS